MTERSIPLAFWVIAGLLMQPAVARPKRVVGKAAFNEIAVNSPETRIPIGPGSSGSAVLRAQILLDRAHFSPGQIDGRFGSDLAVAVKAFRVAKSLPPASRIDAVTWRTLNESADKPALISYTVRASEVKGPFEKIPADMQEKAKLKFLGYESAEEALGAEFHCTPKLLAELNPGKDLSKAGEEILVPNVAARPKVEGTAAQVIVSKSARTVAAVAEDGNVLAIYPATMGSEHDPLPIGEWKITAVRHNPVFNYNPELFWDAKEDDAKARIAPGPKNPVGTVWIGLSKEHYGIHGTPEPGLIGHTQSHGCIRLTNWDVEELAKLVKPGTPAILKE